MEQQEIVKSASLWKDAWKRLLKNKLAVFGLIVVVLMAIAVIIGPAIIKWTTGFTCDFIPPDGNLIKSFPPSLQHPMGTDDSGRDILAQSFAGRQNLFDGRHNFDDCLVNRRRFLRRDGRVSRRQN